MAKYIKKLKEILTGLTNYYTDNPQVKELAEKRASICADCPLNVDNRCSKDLQDKAVIDFDYYEEARYKGNLYNGCNCRLPFKCASPDSICPTGKWSNI